MFMRLLVALGVMAAWIGVTAEHNVASLKENNLVLDTSYLTDSSVKDLFVFLVTVMGRQGQGKSTELRSIALALGITGAEFKAYHSNLPCTGDVSITDISAAWDGIVGVDVPGKDDPFLAKQMGMDSNNVDIMHTRLLAPVSNVVIKVISSHTIAASDLAELALFCDQKQHVGSLSSRKSGVDSIKPTLIITLRTLNVDCSVGGDGVHISCDPQDYLDRIMPATHPARTVFEEVRLLLVPPVVAEEEKVFLQTETFDPKRLPKFWDAILEITKLIKAARVRAGNNVWRAGEVAQILTEILPIANAGGDIHPHDVRTSLLVHHATETAHAAVDKMAENTKPYLTDPYKGDMSDEGKYLQELSTKYVKDVLATYDMHRPEIALWSAIDLAVTTVIETKANELLVGIRARKTALMKMLQDAYESAVVDLSTRRTSIVDLMVGDTDLVNGKLVNDFRAIIDAFTTHCKSAPMLSTAVSAKLDELKKQALSAWVSAHGSNEIKHLQRQQKMRTTAIPAVHERISHHKDECGNGESYAHFDMSAMFNHHFSDMNLQNVMYIDAQLDANNGGGGRLVLNGNNQNYAVHQQSGSGRKGHGSSLMYNPVSKVLTAKIWGWGWGGGNCKNRKWMKGINFQVIKNELSLNPLIAEKYNMGEEPVF